MMAVTPVPVPNLTQYNFAIGDTVEAIDKDNGRNAAIEVLVQNLNTSIGQFNADVQFVHTARDELDAENIVHAPGSGLPNMAGNAYSRSVGTNANQLPDTAQADGRYARRNNNLSDLASTSIARDNLNVYSRSQVWTRDEAYSKPQVDDIALGVIPIGLIAMWSGSVANIPSGWALCNGQNGTPDLRNRFVVGAGSSYTVGATGGANSVTLTTAQMPAHGHSGTAASAGGHSHSASTGSGGSHSHSGSTNSTGAHTHGIQHDNGTAAGSGIKNVLADPRRSGSESWRDVAQLRTASAGAHTHSLSINSAGGHTHSVSVASGGAHTHSVSVGNTGGGEAHENRPPYYALAYIMKL